MADDERRADQMAYMSKQDGDYLVAQGWASLDRKSGVYYVARVRDARGDEDHKPRCSKCGHLVQSHALKGKGPCMVGCGCIGEDHGPEPDALGGLPPSQPKEDHE